MNQTTSKSSTSMNLTAGLPDSLTSDFAEMLQKMRLLAKMEAAERRRELDEYRTQKFQELINGKEFEIVKVFLKDAPGGRLNDFAVVSDYQDALNLLEAYRKIGHNIKLFSLTLFVDGNKWKKFNFKYS